MTTTFELRSIPDGKRNRLFLLQLPRRTRELPTVAEPRTIARLDGAALDIAVPSLDSFLEDSRTSIADRLQTEDAVIGLTESEAIRIGLLFNAINSLRAEDKIRALSAKIAELSAEDAAFWLSKITQEPAHAERHRKGLIFILTEA